MFDNIAPTYDCLNHVLSLGIDKWWRRSAIKKIKEQPLSPCPPPSGRVTDRMALPHGGDVHRTERGFSFLDIATGTGDLAIKAFKELKPHEVIGCDISDEMMRIGRQKVEKLGLADHIRFVHEDCEHLSFADGQFDVVMSAFALRNFEHLDKCLQEMHRVLRPGGCVVIIDLCAPRRFPMRQVFALYQRIIMPVVGKLMSKDKSAYTYLPSTMDAVAQGEEMASKFREAGFQEVGYKYLAFDMCCMYYGKRPLPTSGRVTDQMALPHGGDVRRTERGCRFGLIGRTLGHSFSQRYFTEKFAREGINARYDNYEMPSADGVVELISSTPELVGLNVTIPYKKDVIPLLRSLDPDAEAIGAVNVIRIRDMRGFNTDLIGFRESIRPLLQSHHTHALVLGTGGASLAVNHGLRQLGIEPLSVSRNRREGIITYDDLDADLLSTYKVIVNCTPLGTFPNVDECAPVPYHLLTPDHLLFDLVYNPEETLFLRKGREQGATTKNGYEMLVRQAEAAWEIWNK